MEGDAFEVEAHTPILPEEQQASNLPLIDLEVEGQRPRSRRKRVLQVSLALVALIVAVVVFYRGGAPTQSTPPTPKRPLVPTFSPPLTLINSNINFGTVTINGTRQRGTLPMLLALRNQTYSITLDAPPFQPHSCTFTFANGEPQSISGDTCQTGSGDFPIITANGVTAAPSFQVVIDVTAADLPADQQNQINALLAQSITAQQSTSVPVGSYIATAAGADGTITSQRATTLLRGTALLAASTRFGPLQFPCTGLICQVGFGFISSPALTGQTWIVAVPVALRWRFTNAAGRVVGDVSLPVADILLTVLAYDSKAGWSLSDQHPNGLGDIYSELSNLNCETGTQVMQQQLQIQNLSYGSSGNRGIEGCEITAQPNNGSSQGKFVWRFGVLLAADTAGHNLLPHLPIAPQAEITAVQG